MWGWEYKWKPALPLNLQTSPKKRKFTFLSKSHTHRYWLPNALYFCIFSLWNNSIDLKVKGYSSVIRPTPTALLMFCGYITPQHLAAHVPTTISEMELHFLPQTHFSHKLTNHDYLLKSYLCGAYATTGRISTSTNLIIYFNFFKNKK